MKQLENRNVGTGATRVSIYSDVKNPKSKYPLLSEKKGKITMTEFGQMSYQLLPGTYIGTIELTEKLMKNMQSVSEGTLESKKSLLTVANLVKHDIEVMRENAKKGGSYMSGMTEEKEYYEGTWNGENVKFNRVYAGHRFSDEECESLCAGDTIIVKGLKSSKGSIYAVKGKLAKQTYRGHEYIGFERTDFVQDEYPNGWCKHTFTVTEMAKLKAGEKVEIKDFVSSKGKRFPATVHFEKKDDKYVVVPEFVD